MLAATGGAARGALATNAQGASRNQNAVPSGASPTTVNPAQALVDRYDGGSGPLRSYTGDHRNMMLLGKAEKLAMTGQPREHMMHMEAVIGLGAELAQMDNVKRADYAARAFSILKQPEDQQAAAYTAISHGLPPADDHYVENLAKKYLDTVQDIDQKSRQMTRDAVDRIIDRYVLDSFGSFP